MAALVAFVSAAAVAMAPAAERALGAGHSREEPLFLSPLDERSIVLDRNGGVLATLYGAENRAPVTLAEIPESVEQSVIVVEDADFYSHEGVNLRATVRALFENVSAGGVEQGGSTITMQVVKNSVLTSERTLERKTREAILAVRLEEEFTKDQILERYLNTAYFGNGAYGVQAAAETYWGVDVGALDWGQAALLAALIRNPNGYNPIRFPERAAERRQLALDRLVQTEHLTQDQADLYAFQALPTQVHRTTPPPDDYFVEYVKQQLLDDADFNLGDTPEERYNAVFSGGLRVHTTFDPLMQAAALQARDDVLPGDLPGEFLFTGRVDGEYQEVQGTGVVVTTEVATGAVRTLVGGPGFDDYRYDIATQGERQPGSSFKTFVLAALFEAGYVPSDTVQGGAGCAIPNPGGEEDPYTVGNFGESSGGEGTITSQTQRSNNCAFLRLGQIVGIPRVIEVAQRLGITTPMDNVPSIPLGTEEVRPLEMAGAYATFANDGIYNEPFFVDRITDAEGNLLYQHEADGRRAVSRQTARLVARTLQANVQGGTGTRAQLSAQPAAGKTGTSQDAANIWFVGFTPQYATAVWVGATGKNIPLRIPGPIIGGNYPARIWGQFMRAVTDGTERAEFLPPDPTRSGRGLQMAGERPIGSSTTSSSTPEDPGASTTVRGGPPSSTPGSPPSSTPPPSGPPPTDPPPTSGPPPTDPPGPTTTVHGDRPDD
jgi:penicillin-binding protein 1A